MASTEASDRAVWPPLRDLYDLTLKFEETITNIVPSAAIALLSPVILFHYAKQPVYVRQSPLLWIKLSIAIALVGVEVTSLILRSLHNEFRTETTIPAASLDLLAAITIAVVLFVEHRHAIRPSALLSLYLLLGVFTDAMKSRSFFIRPGLATVGALAASASAIRFILVLLQEVPKTRWLIDQNLRNNIGPEATSGYLSRTFFVFLNPLFLSGYRTVLVMQDLSNLGPSFSSEQLYRHLKRYWNGAQGISKSSLALTCFKAWRAHFLAIVTPRLFVSGFSFAQPFILYLVIEAVGDPSVSNQERGVLVGATAASFIGSAVARMATAHMIYRQSTRLRGGLIAQILDKNLRIAQSEAKKSAAITLMSNDVDGIAGGLSRCYDVFFTLFEVGFGIFLLSRFVGRSCFVVLVPLTLSTIVAYFFGKWIAIRFTAWNASIQSRVAKTARVLGQMQAIKMFGLGPTISSYLQQLRVNEIDISKKHRGLEAASAVPVVWAELVTPVIVVAAALFWKSFDGGLTASTVFPSLSLIVLIKDPLAVLLLAYPVFTSMVGCFQRVETFLRLEERKDPRTITGAESTSADDDQFAPTQRPPSLVQFIKAKIGPLGSQIPILRDLNFTLNPGSITGVAGPNGSGKSLLLQSILGETDLIEGTIRLGAACVAFCSQTVWLRNASIKNNIIGSLAFNERLFRRVIECCLLEEDLASLAGGVEYIVGSGGCKLSGGQRQRVGIARALYARMSIIVLDDIFSSLDRRTAISILFRLCGEDGLLKELGSTVVISTFLPECLDVVEQVIVLDGNGRAELEKNAADDATRQKLLRAFNTPGSLRSEEQETKEQQQIRRSFENQPKTKTDAERHRSPHRFGDWSLYRLFLGPVGKLKLCLWLLLMFSASSGESLPDIYMRTWIDHYADNNLYFIGYASIAVVTCFLFGICGAILFVNFIPRSANGLHQQAVDTVLCATLGFLGSTDTGVILNRFSQDMSLIAQRLPLFFVRTVSVFFQTTIQTAVIASGSFYMVASLPLIAFAVFLVQQFYLRTSRQVRALDLEAKSPLYTHFEETAEGLLHIRAIGGEQENIQDALKLLDASQKAYYYQLCIQQWLGIVLGLLVAAVATILVSFALFFSHTSSQTAIGLSFLNLILFAKTLEALVTAWTGMETCITALERLREFTEETPQEHSEDLIDVPEHWPSMGSIELSGVSAGYGEDEEQPKILKNISLSIEAGQKVGIIGRTGSGKSSLFLTLLGFLKYKGGIRIDGIDISSIPLNVLRSRIVTISQDQIKLDASVRTNLLPFTLNMKPNMQDEKQRQQAARKDIILRELLVRLGIWSHLNSKGGLDANLDDVGYSYGEMQLFCLARAVLRYEDTGSKVILIDEATSSVEYEKEKVAQSVMREYFQHCTILTIGHRRSSIRGAECTVELLQGEVVHIDPTAPDSDDGGAVEPGRRSP